MPSLSCDVDFETAPNSRSKIQPDTAGFLPTPAAASSSRKHYLWTLSFYAQAFDVDTASVINRCRATLYPRANFLDVLEGNPDLYGPVWIATTVVVILFLTGTISQYLAHQGKDHFAYDFKLLSGGAGMVYGYTGLVPTALWAVLKWYGSESANLLECVCLYGYANLIWIPVALASCSPINRKSCPCFVYGRLLTSLEIVLNILFVALGFAASAFFLLRNLYPVLSSTEAKTSKVLLIVVLALHAGFAIAIKVLFFAATSPVGPKDGAGAGSGGEGDDDKKVDMIRMLLRL